MQNPTPHIGGPQGVSKSVHFFNQYFTDMHVLAVCFSSTCKLYLMNSTQVHEDFHQMYNISLQFQWLLIYIISLQWLQVILGQNTFPGLGFPKFNENGGMRGGGAGQIPDLSSHIFKGVSSLITHFVFSTPRFMTLIIIKYSDHWMLTITDKQVKK